MPEPPASLLVPALIRRVAAEGGIATVLARGHDQGSALLIVHLPPSGPPAVYERLPTPSGEPVWRRAATGEAEVDRFCQRQRAFDPDLWIIELAVPSAARFIAALPPDDLTPKRHET
ncbi:DUF1491 family protein [Thermaurantiacus sp.]